MVNKRQLKNNTSTNDLVKRFPVWKKFLHKCEQQAGGKKIHLYNRTETK